MSTTDTHADEFEKALAHLQKELQAIRTGRASPAMVENLIVDAYGTPTPLLNLASISVPESTQLYIQPWDPNLVKSIEKALQASALGIMPTVEGGGIRLHFPPLTEERRHEMVKTVNEMLEKARVAVRAVREGVHKEIKQNEKTGTFSEDVAKVEAKFLQEALDAYNQRVHDMGKQKITELQTI
ncbi:MAG: ribosome recycling factor [Patescibacteria group bacterium]